MPRRARLDAAGELQDIIGQGIEDPCSKLRGIFDRKECGLFYDSLAYPAASGGECARFRGSTLPDLPGCLGTAGFSQSALGERGRSCFNALLMKSVRSPTPDQQE
jgi:hypothetical protein